MKKNFYFSTAEQILEAKYLLERNGYYLALASWGTSIYKHDSKPTIICERVEEESTDNFIKDLSRALMLAYYNTGRPFKPQIGGVYENLNGATYKCTDILEGVYKFTSQIGTGPYWSCLCTGVKIYEDLRIDWAHSTSGLFTDIEGKAL